MKKTRRGVGNNWTKKELWADAKKYNTRKEWQLCSGAAYVAAYRRGKLFFEWCCKHMIGSKRIWTAVAIIKEAKKYNRRTEWRIHSEKSFHAAKRNGDLFFDKCIKHMTGQPLWTDDKIKASAKSFNNLSDWKRYSIGTYLIA